MPSTDETHSGVAGVAPHGQPRTLHSRADDSKTVRDPGSPPVRPITRGKAENPETGPGSKRPEARERRLPPPRQPAKPANRVFVIGADGRP